MGILNLPFKGVIQLLYVKITSVTSHSGRFGWDGARRGGGCSKASFYPNPRHAVELYMDAYETAERNAPTVIPGNTCISMIRGKNCQSCRV